MFMGNAGFWLALAGFADKVGNQFKEKAAELQQHRYGVDSEESGHPIFNVHAEAGLSNFVTQ